VNIGERLPVAKLHREQGRFAPPSSETSWGVARRSTAFEWLSGEVDHHKLFTLGRHHSLHVREAFVCRTMAGSGSGSAR
jgi:hypothetical protein